MHDLGAAGVGFAGALSVILKTLSRGLTCSWGLGSGEGAEGHPSGTRGGHCPLESKVALFAAVILFPPHLAPGQVTCSAEGCDGTIRTPAIPPSV